MDAVSQLNVLTQKSGVGFEYEFVPGYNSKTFICNIKCKGHAATFTSTSKRKSKEGAAEEILKQGLDKLAKLNKWVIKYSYKIYSDKTKTNIFHSSALVATLDVSKQAPDVKSVYGEGTTCISAYECLYQKVYKFLLDLAIQNRNDKSVELTSEDGTMVCYDDNYNTKMTSRKQLHKYIESDGKLISRFQLTHLARDLVGKTMWMSECKIGSHYCSDIGSSIAESEENVSKKMLNL
uniref:DRBM domain-containing protein n=1 Tax=Rhabditophanes sp. KR3021 TaxID=114890 RepID=A0AC35TST6_9BILA